MTTYDLGTAMRKIISKHEAISQGLTTYYTGKPCKRGHYDERYVSTRMCVSCRKYHFKQNVKNTTYTNREKARQRSPEYRQNVAERRSSEKYKNKAIEYRNKNKSKINKERRVRYAEDKSFKLGMICRTMLRRVLVHSGDVKKESTYDMLGYNNKELKEHLESLFIEGMTWDNYGEWHIDHIVPVSWWFENGVTDPSQINSLFNLQPLWAEDNLKKSNKI